MANNNWRVYQNENFRQMTIVGGFDCVVNSTTLYMIACKLCVVVMLYSLTCGVPNSDYCFSATYSANCWVE